MAKEMTTDPVLSTEISTTAYWRATKLLWFDIIVTFGILTAVASRL